MSLASVTDTLLEALAPLRFPAPVAYVYQPLEYARAGWDAYLRRAGEHPRRFFLLGMNPGPFGMAQTGVPFGEVTAVRDFLGLKFEVGRPAREHPKRPIEGLACRRAEVSGARLWGLFSAAFGTPEAFFERAIVWNHCPLVFLEESGRNLTPDKLPAASRAKLTAACDAALASAIALLQPTTIIGIGAWAAARARAVAPEREVVQLLHPSPASPAANRGWDAAARLTLGPPLGLLPLRPSVGRRTPR